MGKQLYFFHAEEDVAQFLSYLDKCCGKFVVNSVLYDPSEMVDTIVAEMSISCAQYTMAHVPDNSFVKQSRYVCIGEGTAIEFTNCRRWKKLHTLILISEEFICAAQIEESMMNMHWLYIKSYTITSERNTTTIRS